jgi:hypothetical protein
VPQNVLGFIVIFSDILDEQIWCRSGGSHGMCNIYGIMVDYED